MIKKLTFALFLSLAALSGCGSDAKHDSAVLAFEEGVHYIPLDQPLDRPVNEVLEFFWYGCPHCYQASPYIAKWDSENGDEAFVTYRHSQISQGWIPDALVYYGLYALERMDVHNDYFDERQKGVFYTKDSLNEFLAEHNLTADSLLDSAVGVESVEMMKRMRDIESSIDSNGVPAFIVGGKYKVLLSGLGSSGGWDALSPLLTHLVELSVSGN